jgi:pyruvate-formate lyase-activating enzyme
MRLIQDSREKAGKKDHILDYFKANGIEVVRTKLFCGDYSLVTDHTVVVDVKQHLAEVYQNLIGKDHERFRDECARAQTCEIKLIVLVEEGRIKSVDEVATWRNPRRKHWFEIAALHKQGKCLNRKIPKQPPASSETLMKSMKTMSERYGVEWRFCEKADTGRVIVEILGGKSE